MQLIFNYLGLIKFVLMLALNFVLHLNVIL